MIAAVALLAVACNKNQSAVKKLDGTWNATSLSQTSDGVTIELIGTFIESATLQFDGCKLKDDEFCNLTTTTKTTAAFGSLTETDASLYNVTDDGTTLQMKDDASSTTIDKMEIIELTKTTGEFKQTDTDGTVTVIKVTKQ